MRQILSTIIDRMFRPVRARERILALLRSKQRDEVNHALEHIRARGWLYDGSLRQAVFAGAQLDHVDLQNADLAGSDFYRADLRGAIFSGACLTGANFTCAHLSNSRLESANLQNAFLWGADLRGANLKGANLTGAFIEKQDLARLDDADDSSHFRLPPDEWDKSFPEGTLFDEDTVMPDGRRWTPGCSLRDFVEPATLAPFERELLAV